jgi:catechol 2,3-dioxygenase-like lactoylglutathione lyase family enzyme
MQRNRKQGADAKKRSRLAVFLSWFFYAFLLITIGVRVHLLPVKAEGATKASKTAAALVTTVDAIGMTVSDMDRALDFYTRVLPFEKVSDVEVFGREWEHLQGLFGLRMRIVRLKLGEESIELTEYLTPRGRPIPADSRSNDRWFQHIAIIVRDMEKAYQHLRQHKVQHASTGPQRLPDWNKNAGGIKAFYFKDPDNHVLEILQFPTGKGNPKWYRPTDRLFLGIDHTAIVVSDTDESLKFYRDILGFEVVGESENYGDEQEHLNNVFGARLRITSIRAASGPSIEFLEYLAPRDGRVYPPDSRASDLWHWQTRLITPQAEAAGKRLHTAKSLFLSPGVVPFTDSATGIRAGLTVRDPDGHALRKGDDDEKATPVLYTFAFCDRECGTELIPGTGIKIVGSQPINPTRRIQ